MAGRKEGPAVAPRTGARRLVELCKDVLIVALTCSAVWLAAQTPIFTELRGWIAPPAQVTEAPAERPGEAVAPYLLCVRNSLGLYGVGYDAAQVDGAFDALSPFLGEGLSTAGEPELIGRVQWRDLLELPGVCCVFQGEPPLAALLAWLGGDETGGTLTGNARTALLAWDGDLVWLAWRDGQGLFYRSATEVVYAGHLETALEEYNPNGASYAYSLARNDDAYSALDPYVPIAMTTPRPRVYAVSAPDFVHDTDELEGLLSALGFRSGVGSAYESGGELALNESGDRLRVGSDGSVTFRAGEEVRYAVSAAGGPPTAAEAALCAWDLLNRAAALWKGEAAYALTGVEQAESGWTVTFETRLDGIPARTGENGFCAVFTVTGGAITDFTLSLRSYTATGETTLLPSQRLAAAALRSLPGSSGQLALCYADTGVGTVTAGWVTETP